MACLGSAGLALALSLALAPRAQADGASQPPPPGTKITMENWQQYKDFMPEGLANFFASKFSWKLPNDAEIDIGPTVSVPEPPTYVAATEQYGNQVQVVHLPDESLETYIPVPAREG